MESMIISPKPLKNKRAKAELGLPQGSAIKNLPVVREPQETRVQSLGQEDHLEEEMETCSSILSCLGNPMDRGAWWASLWGSQRAGHDWAYTHTFSDEEHQNHLKGLWKPESLSPSSWVPDIVGLGLGLRMYKFYISRKFPDGAEAASYRTKGWEGSFQRMLV